MKHSAKNETAVIDLINQIQTQIAALDKKIDALINRAETKPFQRPSTDNARFQPRPHDDRHSHKDRMTYKAICADCKKECTIPFKPSGDRPVYCQDCFSRRKVISLSGLTNVQEKPREEAAPKAFKAFPKTFPKTSPKSPKTFAKKKLTRKKK
jgi:CxxC-x17-CxxC domain-containing protein